MQAIGRLKWSSRILQGRDAIDILWAFVNASACESTWGAPNVEGWRVARIAWPEKEAPNSQHLAGSLLRGGLLKLFAWMATESKDSLLIEGWYDLLIGSRLVKFHRFSSRKL